MKYLSDHFKEIEKRTQFPEEAIPVLEQVAERLDSDKKFGAKFEALRKGYMYGRGRLGNYTKKLEKLAEKYDIHPTYVYNGIRDVLNALEKESDV